MIQIPQPDEPQTLTIYEILRELSETLREHREKAGIAAMNYVRDPEDMTLGSDARVAIAEADLLLIVIQYLERNLKPEPLEASE